MSRYTRSGPSRHTRPTVTAATSAIPSSSQAMTSTCAMSPIPAHTQPSAPANPKVNTPTPTRSDRPSVRMIGVIQNGPCKGSGSAANESFICACGREPCPVSEGTRVALQDVSDAGDHPGGQRQDAGRSRRLGVDAGPTRVGPLAVHAVPPSAHGRAGWHRPGDPVYGVKSQELQD